ncbi:MAG: GPW/gp25 family protein [Chloroflexi bacterium]|jgi:phage baseplate assembly protein W|nr:GPW/gp25 family protein [Chloroflexota bacterium]
MVTERGDFLGTGWAFPVRPVGGRLRLVDGDENVRKSLWLILSTAQGERQMRPEFGCGIHELVFEANTAALRGLVERKVREALVRWEPRIDVLEVTAETPPERRNYLLIRIAYRIRANNALYNLVYPFFLDEGTG